MLSGIRILSSDLHATSGQKRRDFEIAQEMGIELVKTYASIEHVAPDRPNSDFSNCDFSYIDELVDLALEFNKKILLGLYFAPVTGTGWSGTSRFVPHANDNPYVRDIYLYMLDRMFDRGLNIKDLKATGWNEGTTSDFGGTGTNFSTEIATFMNVVYPAIRTQYPALEFASCSFVNDSHGYADTIKDEMFSVAPLNGEEFDQHWFVYNYLNVHVYPNISGSTMFRSPGDIAGLFPEYINNAITQYESLAFYEAFAPSGIIPTRFCADEIGMNCLNAGMKRSNATYGGDALRLWILAKGLSLIRQIPNFEFEVIYRASHTNVDYDATTHAQHYALANSNQEYFPGAHFVSAVNGGVLLASDITEEEVVVPV